MLNSWLKTKYPNSRLFLTPNPICGQWNVFLKRDTTMSPQPASCCWARKEQFAFETVVVNFYIWLSNQSR